MRFAPLLLLALPLAACGTVVVQGNGSDENATVATGANGQVSFKAGDVEASVKLPKVDLGAANFEIDGLKLYPGAKIRELHADGSGEDGKITAAFDAPAPIATVRQWFAGNLEKNGFKVEAQGDGFTGTTKDGDAFKLDLTADGAGAAKGRIEVGS